MRESFIFYRSFFEAIADLPDETKGRIFCAISDYALNEKEPSLSGVEKSIFTLIKPQLDANNKRYENGKSGGKHGVKGGRPKTQNPKKTPPKPQENPTQTPNDNVNVNVNENEKGGYAFRGSVIKITMKDWDTWEAKFFNSNYEKMYKYMDSRDNWLAEQSVKIQKNWFMSTKSDLEKNYA